MLEGEVMSGPFTITAATNTLKLDKKRQAETSFTVVNSSGRALRGRAIVVPENPVIEKWITLVGDAEQDFPIATDRRFSAQIAAPSDAQAGSHSFRLDVLGVDNPDEDLTQGPSVTFDVPAPEPAKKAFPMWIPLVLILVVVLAAIATISFFVIRNIQEQEVARNATQTAVAQQAAKATATAQAVAAVAARYNGTWVKDTDQNPGVSTLTVSNSGKTFNIAITGEYEDTLIDNVWAQSPCSACSWGPASGDFVRDPLVAEFTFGPDDQGFHRLTLNLSSDGSALTVQDFTRVDGTRDGTIIDSRSYTFHRQ
jgi:uncharacterized protein (UPF0333 family)